MKTKKLDAKQLRQLTESVMREAVSSGHRALEDEGLDDADDAITAVLNACSDAMDVVEGTEAGEHLVEAWRVLQLARRAHRMGK